MKYGGGGYILLEYNRRDHNAHLRGIDGTMDSMLELGTRKSEFKSFISHLLTR